MTRWTVGNKLLGEIDPPIPDFVEIRTVEGSYWQRYGGTWESLTGTATSVSSERLYDADRPAVVTYVPAVPPPHTRPGNYVCSNTCAYRFVLRTDETWHGPYYPDGNDHARTLTWEDIEDEYGDCARSLVGPVPDSVLKGL